MKQYRMQKSILYIAKQDIMYKSKSISHFPRRNQSKTKHEHLSWRTIAHMNGQIPRTRGMNLVRGQPESPCIPTSARSTRETANRNGATSSQSSSSILSTCQSSSPKEANLRDVQYFSCRQSCRYNKKRAHMSSRLELSDHVKVNYLILIIKDPRTVMGSRSKVMSKIIEGYKGTSVI